MKRPIVGVLLLLAIAAPAGLDAAAEQPRPRPAAVAGTLSEAVRLEPPVPVGHPTARLPAPGRMETRPARRQPAAAKARRFRDLDGAALADTSVRAAPGQPAASPAPPPLPPFPLADLVRLRARTGATLSTAPAPGSVGSLATPWSADRLLADATHMNDTHVSLARSPVTGHLYAAFESYDLGGTDRDIHLARSRDDGLTWDVRELPAYSLDEYHPDLAIDGAGYLHVAWVRSDGVILRTRSLGPDDPDHWAWVRGLEVGEPCATPSIAVRGAGDFATVLIASGWLTVNWDWYQYEWTLVWMVSTNGGATIAYDYFLPDGYQDFWPDVQLGDSQAYLVNGEQDPYSGKVSILAAADAPTGSFLDVVDLTAWTPMSAGFPSVAAAGDAVWCVYQLDWDDGLGDIEGDIIYCFSWDRLQSVYGPYEIMATTSESVGPSVHARDGVVGCTWLEAPPGGDEFHLAARQGGLDGHPDAWGDVEIVTDLAHVEPQFRSAAGLVATDRLHAAWIDRRDFPTQGLNVYTADRGLLPDLTPHTPAGWSAALVAGMVPGEREDGLLGAGRPAYVSFAVANLGLATTGAGFLLRLDVDGVPAAAWEVGGGLDAGTCVTVEDHELELTAGDHELTLVIDPAGAVHESDESDNVLRRTFAVLAGEPHPVFSPDHLVHEMPLPIAPEEVLAELLFDPPLRTRSWLPVVDERLHAKAGQVAVGPLRIVVTPALGIDAPRLTERLTGLPAAERRAIAGHVLRAHAVRQQAVWSDRVGRLAELAQRAGTMGTLDGAAGVATGGGSGGATAVRQLWLTGEWILTTDAAGVAEIASWPEVGRIWLDDRPSEAFGARSIPRTGATPGLVAPGPIGPAERLGGPDRGLAWHLQAVGAPAAWAAGFDGGGVIVGHIDTGVAHDHPDLAGRFWDGRPTYPNHGWDCLDEDDDPYDGDTEYWHGTHTAGLVVGGGASGTATGAAPGARLMIVRGVPGYYEDLVEALQFCLDHGARLITMSAGWSDPGDALRSANRTNAEVLLAAGIPWFCAAGNGDGAGGHFPVPRDISSPGDCPDPWFASAGRTAVIAVGATDVADQASPTSSTGPTAWQVTGAAGHGDYPWPPGLAKPELAAPGDGVTSTVGGGYAVYSGTSMAAPIVAGAGAILLQASPECDPPGLSRVLQETAVDVDVPGRDAVTGAGRLDIAAALAAVPRPESEVFWVRNEGVLTLIVDALVWDAAWLDISPIAFAVAPGDSQRCLATFAVDGLAPGLHLAAVELADNAPASPILQVSLAIGDGITAADDVEDRTIPAVHRPALTAYPNPGNPRIQFRFQLERMEEVELAIFDVRGHRVRGLVAGRLPAGPHERTWDGRDDRGHSLASGVYLARLAVRDGQLATRKLLLAR
ncbi:MAG: S8 family serine peptidase [Candidatus Krumholzibacteriia bacterium]